MLYSFFAGEESPELESLTGLRQRATHSRQKGVLSSSPLRRRPRVSGRVKWKVSRLVADRKGQSVTLQRPYGCTGFTITNPRKLYFAVEAKGSLEVRPELRVVDPRSLGEFIPVVARWKQNAFRGIHVLPPASAGFFGNASIERKGAYFRFPRSGRTKPLWSPKRTYGKSGSVFKNPARYFEGPEK